MTNECIDAELIGEIPALVKTDPRRLHVENCARCGSLLTSYLEFVKAESVPGADADDARQRLQHFIAQEVDRRSPRARAKPRGFRFSLGALVQRPAIGMALIMIVAAGALVMWAPWATRPTLLRGPATSRPLTLKIPEVASAGEVLLAWVASPGADKYEVRIYSRDLDELARFDAGAKTHFSLARDELPEGFRSGSLFWRVAAMFEGDVIDVSPPGAMELP